MLVVDDDVRNIFALSSVLGTSRNEGPHRRYGTRSNRHPRLHVGPFALS